MKILDLIINKRWTELLHLLAVREYIVVSLLKILHLHGRILVHEIENLYASIPISFMMFTSSCNFWPFLFISNNQIYLFISSILKRIVSICISYAIAQSFFRSITANNRDKIAIPCNDGIGRLPHPHCFRR